MTPLVAEEARTAMIAKAPVPTLEQLRTELARKEAELAQRRAARLGHAWTTSARLAEEHTRVRIGLEISLAEAVARVATSTARCEMNIQDRLALRAR